MIRLLPHVLYCTVDAVDVQVPAWLLRSASIAAQRPNAMCCTVLALPEQVPAPDRGDHPLLRVLLLLQGGGGEEQPEAGVQVRLVGLVML